MLRGMSRGPGTIQRLILEAVQEDGVWPVLVIAKAHGYDVSKLAVRQSFTRAAWRLADDGRLDAFNGLDVPTQFSAVSGYTNIRSQLVVSRCGEIDRATDDQMQNALDLARWVYFPEAEPDIVEAEPDMQAVAIEAYKRIFNRPPTEEELAEVAAKYPPR